MTVCQHSQHCRAKSFSLLLKRERIRRQVFSTRDDAKPDVVKASKCCSQEAGRHHCRYISGRVHTMPFQAAHRCPWNPGKFMLYRTELPASDELKLLAGCAFPTLRICWVMESVVSLVSRGNARRCSTAGTRESLQRPPPALHVQVRAPRQPTGAAKQTP